MAIGIRNLGSTCCVDPFCQHRLGLMTGKDGAGTSSLGQDQDGAEIIDVGARRASDDGIVQRAEKAVAIVILQRLRWRQALRPGAFQRVRHQDRAGNRLQAIDAIGIGGQRPDACRATQAQAERQQILHIAASPALASDRDRGFTAR